jgi:hypothetical protein
MLLTCKLDFDAGADLHLRCAVHCHGGHCGDFPVRAVWEAELVREMTRGYVFVEDGDTGKEMLTDAHFWRRGVKEGGETGFSWIIYHLTHAA